MVRTTQRLVAGLGCVLNGGILWVRNHPLQAVVGFVVLGFAVYLAFGFARVAAAEGAPVLAIVDTDGDGCSDEEELRYGMDPENPYDFFDVPPKDGAINILDIGRIVSRFGSVDGNPNYYVGFDRSVNSDGSVGPPDGAINVTDIGLVVAQFGRYCTETPWCDDNVRDWSPPEEEDDPLDGVTEETICYRIMKDGQVVDYLIATDEVVTELTGEEPLGELPEGLPDPWVAAKASAELGLPDQQQLSAAVAPTVRYWSCDRTKTWKDIFRFPLYRIRLHVDFKELHNAGIYTGAINVYNTWGSQGAWWPWNINSTPAIRKTYVYTNSGPWDFRIYVQKDVGIRANIAGHNIVFKTMHMKWRNGRMPDGRPSCWWWNWTG